MSEYDTWAPVYDAWAADMTEDVAHYAELAREADGPIVELAVGSGRVALAVIQATGKQVLGIDSSPAMLEIARERAGDFPLELRLGDMRDFELDEPAALIYVPFRSLLHLHGWSDKRRAFECVARGLRPGGRFAFNSFAFNHRIAAELSSELDFGAPKPKTERGVAGPSCLERGWHRSVAGALSPRYPGRGRWMLR